MVYEGLKKEMEECSEDEIRVVLERAKKRATEIMKEAEVKADQTKGIHIENADKQIESERTRLLYETRTELRNTQNYEKISIFKRAFSQAAENLAGFRNSEKYEDFFKKMLEMALSEVPGSKVILHIDKRDEALTRKLLTNTEGRIEIHTDLSCLGGLNVSSADGKVIVHNTIESRLEKSKEFLKSDIFSILYGD